MGEYTALELNSFLTALTEKWDESAAIAIIKSFHHLPFSGKSFIYHIKAGNSTTTTGHTDEAGDVTVKTSAEREVRSFAQENVARVGHYKVRKIEFAETDLIAWTHFWASDLTTRDPETPLPSEFGIEYSRETLEPLALLRCDYHKEGFSLFSQSFFDTIRVIWLLFGCLLKSGQVPFLHQYTSNVTVIFRKPESSKAIH